MHEIVQQILEYVRGVWRYRWVALIVAWFVCAIGWVVVLKIPDQYTASAKIYVDTDSVLQPLLSGLATQSNIQNKIELMTSALFSRPNLEKLARMTDLDLKAATPEDMDDLLNRLKQRTGLTRLGRKDFYEIQYTGEDPQMAKNVVQSLLTIFVESSLGEGRRGTDVAGRFLDDQLQEYEKLLQEADNRLAEFKRKNVGLMPSQGGDYYSRLQAAMTSLGEAKFQLEEDETRRNELKDQLAELTTGNQDELNTTQGVLATPDIDQRIQSLQDRMDGLLLRYTEDHPDVVSVRRIIEDLEAQKKQRLEAMEGGIEGIGSATNPIYQQIKISLAEAEATVASSSARVKQFESRVNDLKKMVNILPQIEAQLIDLTRDYDVYQRNYSELLSRREEAKMGQKVETSGESVTFRIIEPPIAPFEPSGPNRQLYMNLVLLVGLGAGIGVALFIALMKPTFDNSRKLIALTGLPVLGEVSMTWSEAQLVRQRNGVVMLVVMLLALMAVYSSTVAYQAQALALVSGLPLWNPPLLDALPF